MTEQQGVTREHPAEINALIDRRRQPLDHGVLLIIATRRQHAAEQQGRIY